MENRYRDVRVSSADFDEDDFFAPPPPPADDYADPISAGGITRERIRADIAALYAAAYQRDVRPIAAAAFIARAELLERRLEYAGR